MHEYAVRAKKSKSPAHGKLIALSVDKQSLVLQNSLCQSMTYRSFLYVLNNPGRAPAYCSSREADALFEEVRQKGNLIAG